MNNNEENLIHDLIFSEETNYKIDLKDYVQSDIYDYEWFFDKIKNILKKSQIEIEYYKISANDTIILELKLKK